MINEKMYKLGSERSEIRELFEYGKKRKAEIGEENVYDFSLGNPSVPCPDDVNEALTELIRSHDATELHGYTSAQGDFEVRRAIAESLTRTHKFDVSADDLYLTAGAAAALTSTLSAIATEGEEVILLAPYFPEYKVFVERAGAVVKTVRCDSEGFMPDASAIAEAINERTAAIIVNSPNNPTGAVYPEASIRAISEVLKSKSEQYGKSIYLIADEPYRELVYTDASVPYIPKYYNDTVVCYSYSKSLSLPGERIGYVMVSPLASEQRRLYLAICGAGRSLGYVCAPSMLQKVLPYCLEMTSDLQIYAKNRQLLLTKLTEYGFETVKPDGAFYLFLKSPIADARAFSEMAKKHELLLVASDSFGYPGYVRISYCVKTDMIVRSLPAFKNLARELSLIGENDGR
jgi:aspartate aminotransferase